MMPRRERAALLLRALLKGPALVALAAGVGLILGVVLAQLFADSDRAEGIVSGPTTAEHSSTTPARRVSRSAAPTPGTQDPLARIRVRVISAVLHPGTTPSGIRRRRGRLAVHVAVRNSGARRVVANRPSLLAARQRVPTNPRADGPDTHFDSIEAGETVDVTLRFETAGNVTEQLRTQKQARVLIGEKSWPFTVKVGNPVR